MDKKIASQLAAEQEFLHTYSGSSALPPYPPIFTPDAMRCRPTLVVGSADSDKREMLITQAYMDACKDRAVFYIDGNPGRHTLDKLFYWNHVLAKKPFYALLPNREMDYLCHTWNPFLFPEKNIDALSTILFDSYLATAASSSAVASRPERKVLFDLIRALQNSGRAYCFYDLRALLESAEMRRHVADMLDEKNGVEYHTWHAAVEGMGAGFAARVKGLVDFLQLFSLWSINSYHPQIDLARAVETSATVYFGLPTGTNSVVASCVGRMLVHQLTALATVQPDDELVDRPPFAVTIDPAYLFLNEKTGDRIYALRPSSVMLSLGFRNLGEMTDIGPQFRGEIRLKAANLFMFNPNCVETANWFAEFGQSGKNNPAFAMNESAQITHPFSQIDGEIKAGSIHDLTRGQCYYWPSHGLEQPVKLETPFLFNPPPIPQCHFHRLPYVAPKTKDGLNLWSVMPSMSSS
jgi:hypothetical protein